MKPSMATVWALIDQLSVATSGALDLEFPTPIRATHACKASPATVGIDVKVSGLHPVATDADLLDRIPAADIFGVGNRLEVVYVPARTILAEMVEFLPGRKWSLTTANPGHDMRGPSPSIKTDGPVSVIIPRSFPDQAIADLAGLGHQPVDYVGPAGSGGAHIGAKQLLRASRDVRITAKATDLREWFPRHLRVLMSWVWMGMIRSGLPNFGMGSYSIPIPSGIVS